MIGQTISHYKILEKLGEGGMGVVYKAEDTKLKRTVALKFLFPQSLGSEREKNRFIHEAQAAAALDHSNICTIHEINEIEGKNFITMAYVDGSSLREKVESGPLGVDRAVDITIQVAEGLLEAHEKGIIHRDIKSANIMLTSKGQAKITDFGLAKLPGRTKLTKTGTAVGTLAYMSPEQARGKEVDQRTDIWSLGIVLYELLTGRVPFRHDNEAAMSYLILNEDVVPPSDETPEVPAELDSIVAKMLQKNPDDRYATTEQLLSDLRKLRSGLEVKVALPMSRKAKRLAWGLSAALVIATVVSGLILLNRGPSPVIAKTLAVVDFDIIDGEETSHLSAGLAEGISVKLSKLGSIRVVSSDEIRQLRKRDLSAKEVASQLGAQYALRGSLFRSGQQIRVTPQLIDASSGDVIWSELFDREFNDVFGFLDEVSLKIVAALKLELDPAEKVAMQDRPTGSPEAYDHYLKGRYYYYRVGFRDNELAGKEFQRALRLDPGYALALAGLADAYVQRYKERYDYDEFWLDEADSLIDKALQLEPDLAEAYESRAEVLFEKENLLGALEAASKAKELRPDWDEPYLRLGEIYRVRGEGTSALEMFEQALKIRPSVDGLCGKGGIYQIRGRVDSAEAAYNAAAMYNPKHDSPFFHLGRLCWDLDDDEKAEEMFRRAIEVRPDRGRSYRELMGLMVWEKQHVQEAEELIRGFVDRYPYNWDAYEVLFELLAWQKGDWPAAMEVIDEAVARNPDRAWPHLFLAAVYSWEMGETPEPQKCIAAVETALKLRPKSGRVLHWAGDIYRDLGYRQRALHYYRLALYASPGSPSILGSMAQLLIFEARFDSAAVVAAQAIEQSPGVISARGWNNYERLKIPLVLLMRTEEFLHVIQDAADKYGRDNPLFYVHLGEQQCLSGQYEEAMRSYRRVLDIGKGASPISVELRRRSLAGLGIAQWLSGDIDGALSSIRESKNYSCLIAILKYLGRFDQIEELIDSLREAGEMDRWIWRAIDYYPSMRRFDDILSLVAEALESEDFTWKTQLMFPTVAWHRQKGDLEEAKEVLKNLEQSLPLVYRPGLDLERAAIEAVEGNLVRAQRSAEEALEGSIGDWNRDRYRAFLAKLCYARGLNSEALDVLTKADGVGRNRVAAFYQRAQLKMVMDAADAEDHLRRALFFAIRASRDLLDRWDLGEARAYFALASARLGDSKGAKSEIEYALKLEPEREDIAYLAAAAYSLIGDTTLALRWLETAVERGHQELWWARVDPDLDNLRELPRFNEIMEDWELRIEALIN